MKSLFTTILLSVIVLASHGQYHLITDQSFYFTGEEMYINVLKNDAANSEVISVILCNGNQGFIQGNVLLRGGAGTIRFQLPKKMNSGVYALQVFTQAGNLGSVPVRINNRDDEGAQKLVNESEAISDDLISVDLNDSLQTASKVSATLSLRTAQTASLNVSVTNRKPALFSFPSTEFSSKESLKSGVAVKGYIKNESGEVLPNHSFMMVVPIANDFYTGRSNEEGYFELDVDVFLPVYDAVFLSLSPQIHHKIQVDLESYECLMVESKSNREIVSAKRELVNMVINEAFSPLDFTTPNSELKNNYSRFYDRHVRPSEYTSSTMFQVFNDIVPKVHVRKNTFGMYALESTTKLKVPPLIFVNGIPTYDYDFVLNMEVEQVESIGVIASFRTLRTYFQAGNGGIIEINTVDKNIVPPISGNVARLKGIDDHLNEGVGISSEDVSFSSLLLYKSGVEIIKEESQIINFETSLESGTYYFVVSGMTNDGKVIHESVPFTISQANQ